MNLLGGRENQVLLCKEHLILAITPDTEINHLISGFHLIRSHFDSVLASVLRQGFDKGGELKSSRDNLHVQSPLDVVVKVLIGLDMVLDS